MNFENLEFSTIINRCTYGHFLKSKLKLWSGSHDGLWAFLAQSSVQMALSFPRQETTGLWSRGTDRAVCLRLSCCRTDSASNTVSLLCKGNKIRMQFLMVAWMISGSPSNDANHSSSSASSGPGVGPGRDGDPAPSLFPFVSYTTWYQHYLLALVKNINFCEEAIIQRSQWFKTNVFSLSHSRTFLASTFGLSVQ